MKSCRGNCRIQPTLSNLTKDCPYPNHYPNPNFHKRLELKSSSCVVVWAVFRSCAKLYVTIPPNYASPFQANFQSQMLENIKTCNTECLQRCKLAKAIAQEIV